MRYFVAVADTGHVTRAAQRLGIQQPPLSQQIRALERELGLQLFTRHPKGVSLTDAGELFVDEARRILADVDAAQQRLQRVARGLRGLVRVGVTSSAAVHGFTPLVLRACRREFPEVELQIAEDNAAALTDAVAAGRIDCALLRVPVSRPGGLRLETLLSEPAVLALPNDHPLATAYRSDDVVPLTALHDQPWILTRRAGAPGLYGNLLDLLDRLRIGVVIQAEVDRMMTNINLVAAGIGISVVPASMQGSQARFVAYRKLPPDPALEAPITLVSRERHEPLVASTFRELVLRMAEAQRVHHRDGAENRK